MDTDDSGSTETSSTKYFWRVYTVFWARIVKLVEDVGGVADS